MFFNTLRKNDVEAQVELYSSRKYPDFTDGNGNSKGRRGVQKEAISEEVGASSKI